MRHSSLNSRSIIPALMLWFGAAVGLANAPNDWRAADKRAVLKNDSMEASFQSGLLYQLKDRRSGDTLLSVDPADLPSKFPLFGSAQIDLDDSTVTQEAKGNSLISRIHIANGTDLELRWSAEPGSGDLVLQTSARCPKPVDEMRILFFGCDIARHNL